jgi:hypothetical protein
MTLELTTIVFLCRCLSQPLDARTRPAVLEAFGGWLRLSEGAALGPDGSSLPSHPLVRLLLLFFCNQAAYEQGPDWSHYGQVESERGRCASASHRRLLVLVILTDCCKQLITPLVHSDIDGSTSTF